MVEIRIWILGGGRYKVEVEGSQKNTAMAVKDMPDPDRLDKGRTAQELLAEAHRAYKKCVDHIEKRGSVPVAD